MMTLGNMRENGVRSLAITCGAVWCHHQAVLEQEVQMVQMDWFFRHKRFFVVCLCVLVGLLLVVRLASFLVR